MEDVGRDPEDFDPNILVHATCVRAPVFIGHAEAVNIEFEKPVTDGEARSVLKKAPGVIVVDHRVDEGYVTPLECVGEDAGPARQPDPQGSDRRQRPVAVVRLRQSAQGRRAQRGADRRSAGARLSEIGAGAARSRRLRTGAHS